ncbi:MAG: sodium-dependent transporter [Acidobacteria bacterium]|nr:MAG: sodium-dependent transporter [Acidobacteriota bacterium]
MIPEDLRRGNFGSKVGFILAAAGSAIGLGNIWRFPYTAGESGGGAFVLVYLLWVVLLGVPVLLAELAIGRASQRNPVGAFRALAPGSWWPAVGGLGVLTGFGILAFYSVVAGWTLGYLAKSISGGIRELGTPEASRAAFGQLIGDPLSALFLTFLFLLLTVLVVRGGVQGGIERASKFLMPLFFLLLVVLAVRAVTLPGASEGLRFLFHFEWEKITPRVAMTALGQALFSLSLGMGAMITYGSYLPRSENLPFSGASVAFFDTLIALLAGLIIFPAVFATGGKPDAGPGLVFVVMPTVFDKLPLGVLFAVAFYALLAIAALTSTISLLEVIVAYLVDERGWDRSRASFSVGGACFVVAVPSALSQGGAAWLSEGGLFGLDFLTLQSILFGNYALSIGALLICLFVGWRWGTAPAVEEMRRGAGELRTAALWSFLVRYFCPLAVAAVLAFIVVTRQYF